MLVALFSLITIRFAIFPVLSLPFPCPFISTGGILLSYETVSKQTNKWYTLPRKWDKFRGMVTPDEQVRVAAIRSTRRWVARSLPATRPPFHDHLLFRCTQFYSASRSPLAPRKNYKSYRTRTRSNNMLRSTLKPIKTSDNVGRASACGIHLPRAVPLSRIHAYSPFYARNGAARTF